MSIDWSNGQFSTATLTMVVLPRATTFAGRITSGYNRGLAIAGLMARLAIRSSRLPTSAVPAAP